MRNGEMTRDADFFLNQGHGSINYEAATAIHGGGQNSDHPDLLANPVI
jgi:hypothetical protein